jgi:hypothetical protein
MKNAFQQVPPPPRGGTQTLAQHANHCSKPSSCQASPPVHRNRLALLQCTHLPSAPPRDASAVRDLTRLPLCQASCPSVYLASCRPVNRTPRGRASACAQRSATRVHAERPVRAARVCFIFYLFISFIMFNLISLLNGEAGACRAHAPEIGSTRRSASGAAPGWQQSAGTASPAGCRSACPS